MASCPSWMVRGMFAVLPDSECDLSRTPGDRHLIPYCFVFVPATQDKLSALYQILGRFVLLLLPSRMHHPGPR